MNVLEALALAGGPADFANLQSVIIIRKNGENLSAIRVKLGDLLKGSPSSDDLTAQRIPQIRSGDTVIVP